MKNSNYRRTLIVICVGLLLLPPSLGAQQSPKKFELTVDNIMRGTDLIGFAPTEIRWSLDGQRLYFRWKRAGEARTKEATMYVVNRDGSGMRQVSEDEIKKLPPSGATSELSKDKKLTLFTEDGDIFLYDNAKGERRQITRTVDTESNARFLKDQKHISFVRQGNIYMLALDGGELVQLTDIRTSAAPDNTLATGGGGGRQGGGGGGGGRQGGGGQGGGRQGGGGGQGSGAANTQQQRGTDSQEFVKKEQRDLLQIIDERVKQREEQDAQRKERDQQRPPQRKPFQVPAGQTPGGMSLSPDGKYAVVTVNEPATGSKPTIVPNYVTESSYTEDIPSRTNVGDVQNRSRMAVIATETGNFNWVDHGQRDAASNAAQGDGARQNQAPRDRQVQLTQAVWSEDGEQVVVMGRSADNKDRWLMQLDPVTGKTKVLDHIHDDAWVGGPGSFTLGWLPDNKRVYFESERDGYAHLYTVSIDGGTPQQLTSGAFEVDNVRLSDDKTKFYFISSEIHPGEKQLYSMPVTGGTRTRITSLSGNNQPFLSPDESTLALIRSYTNKPPDLYLQPNKPGAEAKQITNSPSEEWLSYKWLDPPIVTFKARDGATVYAHLYKPANFQRGGPAVFFVHGAGYLQNVHRGWSQYYRERMFNQLLMERGYIVMDIDYRASAGYGRDWRTGIYRHMGGKDMSDHVDAARYLVSEHGVDPKRIGLYGGSYGGFITLMGMFTEPDVFAAGAALRPVTDWAHYNHGYTANILNVPQSDTEAYRKSSPIYFAQGLKGALLICHGMVDTNVHFQDSVRLVQRLIELRKENWELAVYPVEDHGFEQPSSWADEYKRILKLFAPLHPDFRPSSGNGSSVGKAESNPAPAKSKAKREP